MGATALISVLAAPARAQEAPKQEAPKQEEPPKEDEKPTPWPPPDTEKHEIKRTADQGKGLLLHTPKSWKKGEPASSLRLAEFSIPAAEGDSMPVELTVSSFAGAGGGVQANVQRWVGQFQEGRKVEIFTGEGHQGLYVLVDLKGTYNMPDGPPIQQKTKPLPNARMLAVIIGIRWDEVQGEGDNKQTVKKSAVYFLKMAGPEKTVTANEEGFRLAFGATNRTKETPFDQKDDEAAPPAN
jgi:gluconolactonase